jgi:hypothetical protein
MRGNGTDFDILGAIEKKFQKPNTLDIKNSNFLRFALDLDCK